MPSTPRRRPWVLTIAAVVAAIMAFWGYAELTAPFTRNKASACAAGQNTVTKRSAVTVSIYNAGAPTGSAARLATSLRGLGFKVATVTNAPVGFTVGSVEVVGTSSTDPAAQLVAGTFGVQVTENPSLLVGAGVNVFIGAGAGDLVQSAPAEITTTGTGTC